MPRLLPALALGALCAALSPGCRKKADPAPPGVEVTNSADTTPGPSAAPTPSGPPDKAEAARRLKQVGKAFHDAAGNLGYFPVGVVGPKDQLGLSWRVALLPYLGAEEAKLYGEFKLDEPWDGPHNRKLIAKMPAVYAPTGGSAAGGKTHLRSFTGHFGFVIGYPPEPKGKGKPFFAWAHLKPGNVANGYSVTAIADGAPNTLIVAEAPEPVEWTKPDELPFHDSAPVDFPGAKLYPVPKLGGQFPGGFHGLMGDGAVHFFPDTLSQKTLRALISVNAGEVLGADAVAILNPPDPRRAALPKEVPAAFADAAARTAAAANLRTLLKGMQAFHDAYGHLPVGVSDGKGVGLSWRVQVLPYIGAEELYKEFKLTEPWDSAHNQKLIEKMPAVFDLPNAKAPGHTFIRTTSGTAGLAWTSGEGPQPPTDVPAGRPARGRRLTDIQDGPANTIVLAEGRDAVPWTKPDELPMSLLPGSPPPPTGGAFAGGFHALFGDGRVVFYRSNYPPDALAKLFTAASGEPADPLDHPAYIGYALPPAPAGKPK